MNAAKIKSILAELGVQPSQRLGQNFLIDGNVLNKIVDAAEIKSGDLVLEIGPGLGVLTQALLDRGAQVIAIEKDRRFAEYLETQFHNPSAPPLTLRGGENNFPLRVRGKEGVTITQGDAVKMDWEKLVGGQTWKFISNLPYSITSLALRTALYTTSPPSLMVVLVQREVAERIVRPSKTSLLSLMVALSSKSAKILSRVSANSFYPIPKVESAILQIVPMTQEERIEKWGIEPEEIMKVARLGFAHPRKLLRSNLGLGAETTPLQDLGVNEKARAEDLSPDDWARLALRIHNPSSLPLP